MLARQTHRPVLRQCLRVARAMICTTFSILREGGHVKRHVICADGCPEWGVPALGVAAIRRSWQASHTEFLGEKSAQRSVVCEEGRCGGAPALLFSLGCDEDAQSPE